jgi:pyrroline-5-carboxylate reductase
MGFVQSIASKKGTTQAGVNFLKSQNLKKIMYTTLHRAYKRAKEISIEKQGHK